MTEIIHPELGVLFEGLVDYECSQPDPRLLRVPHSYQTWADMLVKDAWFYSVRTCTFRARIASKWTNLLAYEDSDLPAVLNHDKRYYAIFTEDVAGKDKAVHLMERFLLFAEDGTLAATGVKVHDEFRIIVICEDKPAIQEVKQPQDYLVCFDNVLTARLQTALAEVFTILFDVENELIRFDRAWLLPDEFNDPKNRPRYFLGEQA